MTPLNQNQFTITPVQGQADLQFPGAVISAQIASTVVGTVIAGQALKVENSAGGVPKLLPLTSNSDIPAGVALRNAKNQNYVAGSALEFAQVGQAVWMIADGAIPRFGMVEFDYTTNKITSAGLVNPVLGYAFDEAFNDGDLIRMVVMVPNIAAAGTATLAGAVQVVRVTATLAQINAGFEIVPALTGKSIEVVNFTERVLGNFTTATAIQLVGGTSSTIVESTLIAAVTDGAVLIPGSANVSLGAGYAAPLTASENLKVIHTGTAAAGGTSITYTVSFKYV